MTNLIRLKIIFLDYIFIFQLQMFNTVKYNDNSHKFDIAGTLYLIFLHLSSMQNVTT